MSHESLSNRPVCHLFSAGRTAGRMGILAWHTESPCRAPFYNWLAGAPVKSVEAKIARAKEHFAQVQHEIDIWLESGSFTVSYEPNEAGDEHYLKANLIGAAPNAARWALMLGDGMTNLRDSLDHLIYQISNPNLVKPQYRKAAFVIVRDSKDFKKEANNKLAGVSKKTRAAVESFQPYNRPHHTVAPSLLGALAHFANTNKHRLLLPVFTVPQNLRFNFDLKTPSRGRVATMVGNMEDGGRFFVYKTDVPEPGTTLTFPELKTEIALPHESSPGVPPIAAGRSATRTSSLRSGRKWKMRFRQLWLRFSPQQRPQRLATGETTTTICHRSESFFRSPVVHLSE